MCVTLGLTAVPPPGHAALVSKHYTRLLGRSRAHAEGVVADDATLPPSLGTGTFQGGLGWMRMLKGQSMITCSSQPSA